MFRKSLIAGSALALLAVAPLAQADHDRYWNDPQVRLGIDVIWGGSGWVPARHYYGPPRNYGWYAPPPRHWSPPRYYGPPAHWKGRGHWRQHRHHRYDGRHEGWRRGHRHRDD